MGVSGDIAALWKSLIVQFFLQYTVPANYHTNPAWNQYAKQKEPNEKQKRNIILFDMLSIKSQVMKQSQEITMPKNVPQNMFHVDVNPCKK